jgi:N-acetyl-gamma-glutamyl-phosphate reductase
VKYKVGLVGARGHTGAEIVRLIDAHPSLELAFAVSRAAAGKRIDEVVPGVKSQIVVEDTVARASAPASVDAVLLALPNGESGLWVDAYQSKIIVDLSADHRFDDWVYGLPERNRATIKGARHIANPGCYATGAQLGLAPILDVIAGMPTVFGVSGYSGAGTTPSPRNDVNALRDNLMPYALVGHMHEREVSRHLNHRVAFMPHVAQFFRGITLTISAPLKSALTLDALKARYRDAYAGERLIRVVDDIPLVRDAANRHDVTIGGFAVDETHAVIIVTLDNLLKGAATQAIQNLNIAFGLDEYAGIPIAGAEARATIGGA